MRRLITVVILLLSWSVLGFADATQINLSGTPGSVTMTSWGTGNTVLMMFGNIGGVANNSSWQVNYVVQSLGKFTLSQNANPITATLNSSGSWDVNMNGQTLGFSFVANDGNSVTGDVVLVSMADGTNSPIMFGGNLFITGSSGSPLFTSLWPAASTVHLDYVFGNQGYPWVSDIAGMERGATRTYTSLSSGQVNAAPEPGSIALLGTGLMGLAGLLRRKFRS